MRASVTTDEVRFYRESGFLVVGDLLDAGGLERWRGAVDGAVGGHGVSGRDLDPEQSEYYDRVFLQRVNLWKTSVEVRELVLDGRFGRLAAALALTDEVRLYHDHALIKLPWANPTNWHADNPYDPYRSDEAIMLWIALDDADARNGCLHFLPGSHRRDRLDHGAALDEANVGALLEANPEFAAIEPEMAEVAAGAGIFINGMTAHAAGANMSRRPRRAFSMLFIPGRCGYTGQAGALPAELVARLQPGDVLDDDEHLPMLYRARSAARGSPASKVLYQG